MSSEIKEQLVDLEFALCSKLRPTFLTINESDDKTIQIIVSCIQFKNKSIQQRISIIFRLIESYVPDILKDRLIVVQAYDNLEIDNILDDIFSQELF